VSVQQDGDSGPYAALLESTLQKTGMRRPAVVQKLLKAAMWPADLAGLIRRNELRVLAEKAELTDDQMAKVAAAFGSPERLHELDVAELQDRPRIELNDGGVYKESHSLSTGQKCTAILPILLLESEKPLLIDQPEDNLDNGFIADTVVKSLLRMKMRRQIIFVTHNPNIPVLADAERVLVMKSDGTSARLEKSGTVDQCKNEIVTLLEGGKEAFELRRRRYGSAS
jgi:ABC-type glutathione transport system ATPase component